MNRVTDPPCVDKNSDEVPFPRNGSHEGMTIGPIQRFQQGYPSFGGSSINPSHRFGQQHCVKLRGTGRASIYEAGVFDLHGPDQDRLGW